jgi:hypothetical protein
MTPDPQIAALDKLASQHEHITQLDTREAAHFATLTARLTEITDMVTATGRTLHDSTAALARLESLDQQVAGLTAQLNGSRTGGDGSYQPAPAPAWWRLAGPERHEPLARLRAWVEQVYRPGYSHLAAGLGFCWESHDLCLYGLDILSQLWSALYLQPERSAGLLSAQAEYQARLLPALAGQMRAETSRCGHPRSPVPGTGRPRSMP